jgi:HD-GYP domain-containing protein (c-di-GMP phosphodiesterase class II)/DNA-binding LacI/PurR family transcriptional regulator
MVTKKSKYRPTFGFLVDNIESSYQSNILKGVINFVEENDINLLCFEGGAIETYFQYEIYQNKIYQLVNKNNLDGLIILAATIARDCSSESIKYFCQSFSPLPVVSIGYEIENIPSVLIENRKGFLDLMEHIITTHNCKRIAFIKGTQGNHDAQERYSVYKEALHLHQIPLQDELVVKGDFLPESGVKAIKTLLDKRKVSFDAIVASNDHMAIGAIEELRKRGIYVPYDVIVTGFDNLNVSAFSIPALTTISQPLYEQGKIASQALLDLISHKKVEQKIVLPSELIIRDSCSYYCSIKSYKGKKEDCSLPLLENLDNDYNISLLTDQFIKKLSYHKIKVPSKKITQNLFTAFLKGIEKNKKEEFYKLVNQIASTETSSTNSRNSFHILFSAFRSTILPMITDAKKISAAEDMFYHSIVLFCQEFIHNTIYSQDEILGVHWFINNILQQQLYYILDKSHQIDVLNRRLPEVGIKTCFISLYSETKDKEAEIVLSFNESGIIDPSHWEKYIFSEKLLPKNCFPEKKRFSYLVESLKNLGFMIIEMVPEEKRRIYRILRDLISIALQSSILFQEVQEQKNNLNLSLTSIRQAMEGYIETMALILETRDPYTAGHQRRVSDLARGIADEMGLSKSIVESIRMAGLVHDLGKICIPSEILNKPGRLQDIEFQLIKTHPAIGYNVLKNIEFPWPIADIVHQHHEKLDGSGYPLGLSGDQIRIEAKILCVADVVEAISSHRPYRAALGIEKALEEITKNKGKFYDEKAVKACITLFKEKNYIFKKGENFINQ